MKTAPSLLAAALLIIVGAALAYYASLTALLAYIAAIIIMELLSKFSVKKIRKYFQWMITPEDEAPEINKDGLEKFISFGYDPELGWTRKPNTSKSEFGPEGEDGKHGSVTFHINEKGARSNPGHEELPALISCYGDSFTFARQIEDNQTWEWQLSELTKSNVLNFGIGNYGTDQALLRLKREFPKNRTKIVIMGIVPSTMVRILDVWKHYNEFGNTFGFKPRFDLNANADAAAAGGDSKNLKLIPNIIDSEEKFLRYRDFLPELRKNDYFYQRKFRREMVRFPYFISLLADARRNIPLIWKVFRHQVIHKEDVKSKPYPTAMSVIMKVNLRLRRQLYTRDAYARDLFVKLLQEFARYVREQGASPVFLFMPQKDDVLFIREKGGNPANQNGRYYAPVIGRVMEHLPVVDFTNFLLAKSPEELNALYSDRNDYGGHYSALGNKLLAEYLHGRLKEEGLI